MNHHSLPVFFEQVKVVKDGRFTLAKVYIAHVGENRNRCYFSKEVLESMIPSLANIPILAYVKEDEEGNKDFGNHERRIFKKGKQLYLRYEGHAYGLVPLENNARFEMRYGEDGIEREYLVCDVLLWNKFDDVIEIINEGNGFKNQSMELFPQSTKGYKDEHGVFIFQEAMFDGLCLLGDKIDPAMISSTIELFSSVKEEMGELITEFNSVFSAEKGDIMEDVNTKSTEELENPVTETTEVVENADEVTESTDETAEQADFAEKKDEEKGEENTEEKDEEEDEDKDKKDFSLIQFELSHEDIRSHIYKALENHESFKDEWHWISDVYDNYFIAERDGKLLRVNYVKHENAVSIGEFEEAFKMVLTHEEKVAIEQNRATIQSLEENLKVLQEFKNGIEYSEKEEKLNSFSHILDTDSYDTIKENLSNFSIIDIEKEVGLYMLRNQVNFSAKEQGEASRVQATGDNTESNPFGSLSVYFKK